MAAMTGGNSMPTEEKHVEVIEHLICRTSDELLQSPAFRKVLIRFLRYLERRASRFWR